MEIEEGLDNFSERMMVGSCNKKFTWLITVPGMEVDWGLEGSQS